MKPPQTGREKPTRTDTHRTNVTMVTSSTPRRTTAYGGAGILLTRLDADGPRFLLLCGRDSHIWSFPKGHPESGDRGAPLRTAVRETHEETGFVAGRDYTIYGSAMRFGKRPYWLGILDPTNQRPLCLAAREHLCARWFSMDELVLGLKMNSDVRDWCAHNGPGTPFYATLMSASQMLFATQPTHSTAPVNIAF